MIIEFIFCLHQSSDVNTDVSNDAQEYIFVFLNKYMTRSL
jgi:hypothetical protein